MAAIRELEELMIFARRLSSEGHTRRFTVEHDAAAGWAAREEEDNRIVRLVRVQDWHRVERLIAMFDLKADVLQNEGWQEIHTPA